MSTGASFTAFTIIVAVADEDVSSPSVTKYVNVVVPLKSKSGVNVAILSVILTSPFEEFSSTKYDKSLLSISLPESVIWTEVSSSVVLDTSADTGASFTAFTVSTKSWESTYSPSVTFTLTVMLPL